MPRRASKLGTKRERIIDAQNLGSVQITGHTINYEHIQKLSLRNRLHIKHFITLVSITKQQFSLYNTSFEERKVLV